MKLKNAVIILYDETEMEREENDVLENVDIHYYYHHNRPPNFSLKSKWIHFFVKRLKDIIDFIHGIESEYKLCCVVSFICGRAWLIKEKHQYFCYKCYKKIKNSKRIL